MKASAILCAALAGTFGFSSLAIAQDGRRGDREHRAEHRQDRRDVRDHRGPDRRDFRGDRRDDRRDFRAERRDDRRDFRNDRRDWNRGYHVQPPRYVYSQPTYRSHAPRFHRGGYLPAQYRGHGYYVNNWNAYPSLYAPPYGHQWVQVGSDFLLVAVATGLIANLLMQ